MGKISDKLRAIAAAIAGRQLPDKPAFAAQRELQRRLVAELESGAPARPLASIADDLDSFGIGAWAPLVAQLRALAASPPAPAKEQLPDRPGPPAKEPV